MADTKPERCIALVTGESGAGKSLFCASLKNALLYDTDIGGGLAYADTRIARNNSERMQVGSYVEILDDLKRRQNQGGFSKFLFVVIDHVSSLQQESNERHNPTGASDFGRANHLATREWRRIREFCRNFDFNFVVTAHLKAKWENEKAVGVVADGAKNLEADMMIALELRRGPKYPSNAIVRKWRRDPEDPRGLIPPAFPFTVEEFERLCGPGIFAPRDPVKLAESKEIARLQNLIDTIKLPEGIVEKWFKKAGVETFAEMSAVDLGKCIIYVQDLLVKATNGKAGA